MSSMFDELEPATSASSRVRYRRDYLNPNEEVVFSEEVDSLTIGDYRNYRTDHAILVIQQLYTNQARDAYRPDLPSSVVSSGSTLIVIKSRAVIHALRTVVGYYPDSGFTGDTVKIREPFPVLYHYRQQLQEYADQFTHQPTDCQEDNNVAGDIRTLLTLFEDICGQRVRDELTRYELEDPTCTHDMLWMLFKPGSDIYGASNDDSIYNAFIVRNVAFRYVDAEASKYNVQYWHMATSPTYIGASQPLLTTIEPFAGEKSISDLTIFPCAFMNLAKHGVSHKQRYKQLVSRGKMMFDLFKGPGFAEFHGYTANWPPVAYRGRVMVDIHQYVVDTGIEISLATDVEMSNTIAPRCVCSYCTHLSEGWSQRRINFTGYSRITPVKVAELTEHQNFLAAYGMWAFLLRQRTWKFLKTENFSRPEFRKDTMSTLIIPDTTIRMLQGLHAVFTSTGPRDADSIEEGGGSVVLIHGPPGVGKTYTAECVAEDAKRPLISLTGSHIGTEPELVEKRLLYWFNLAKVWGAVLLIDEADMFLEGGPGSDLHRNLVAIFLRTLEYHQGLLFLTTNRVGVFDDTVTSRIHVLLYLPALDFESRVRLWEMSFRRLTEERQGKIKVTRSARNYIRKGRDPLDQNWNGREIRNGCQTAEALAESEARGRGQDRIVIKKHHIAAVVGSSGDFKRAVFKAYRSFDDPTASTEIRDDQLDEGRRTSWSSSSDGSDGSS